MTVEAPRRPPQPDELEALIREARARQRKRRLAAAVVVALLAGTALALYSITSSGSPSASHSGVPIPAAATGKGCGVRGSGVSILGADGRTLYREPGRYIHPNRGFPTIRCSGSTIWAVWFNGAGMSQEAYLGARSLDRGRTWKLIFTEGMFGPKAPHQLDAYLAAWALHGPHDAYFVGSCPACGRGGVQGTVSLSVTKDGGRTFRTYDVPALTGYAVTKIRVDGNEVTLAAKRFMAGVDRARKTVTIRVG
jgi:hypothetical protein